MGNFWNLKLCANIFYFRMQAIGRTTQWHESQQKFEVQRQQKKNDKLMKEELKHANDELKVLRHERLLNLYKEEAQSHEAELNQLGFAILKDRLWKLITLNLKKYTLKIEEILFQFNYC